MGEIAEMMLDGTLCGLEGSEIIVTLEPPEPGMTEATGAEIDGTRGHPTGAKTWTTEHCC